MRISDWSSDVCSSDLIAPSLAEWHHHLFEGQTLLVESDLDLAGEEAQSSRVESHRSGSVNGFEWRRGMFAVSLGRATEIVPSGAAMSTHLHDRKSVVEGKSVSVRVNMGGICKK